MSTKPTELPKAPPAYVLGILFVAVLCRYVYSEWSPHHGFPLGNFGLPAQHIYADALNDWNSGADPYRTIHGALRFVYPPVFLYIGSFLSRIFPDHVGWVLYALIHMTGTLALPLVLARFYFCQPWLTPAFALLVFLAEPRLTGVLALVNGNIASIMYLLALLAGVPGLRANRWTWFYLAVFIGALVKFPFLLLLLLPLLVGAGQLRNCALCITGVAAAYLAQQIAAPVLYVGYEWSIEQQLVVINHYGYGVLGIAAGIDHKLHGHVGVIPSAVSAAFTLALVTALFLLRRRIPHLACNRIWISLILLSAILASPRILFYDADVALMAAYVIFVHVLATRRLVALLILLFLPSLAVPWFVHSPTLAGIYETLLMMLAFGSGFVALWRSSTPLPLDQPRAVSVPSAI